MSNQNNSTSTSSFSDTFFSKLKEQSFTIILLVGIMYYQNTLFTKQVDKYEKMVKEKEELMIKLSEEERTRLLEREKYLITQRDKFVQDLIDKNN